MERISKGTGQVSMNRGQPRGIRLTKRRCDVPRFSPLLGSDRRVKLISPPGEWAASEHSTIVTSGPGGNRGAERLGIDCLLVSGDKRIFKEIEAVCVEEAATRLVMW
jgi:hypothetical protein